MHCSLLKKIALLSLAFFFLAILAIAFDHYDNAFLLQTRSICKVKAATSGPIGKSKSDSAKAVMGVSLGVAVFPLLTAVAAQNTTIFISARSAYIWPNKAPPVNS